jgi:hypothetical protein
VLFVTCFKSGDCDFLYIVLKRIYSPLRGYLLLAFLVKSVDWDFFVVLKLKCKRTSLLKCVHSGANSSDQLADPVFAISLKSCVNKS